MASTWIDTHKFYSKLQRICRSAKVPTLTTDEQKELFPKLVRTIGHSDFMDKMTQYIDELSLPEEERGYYEGIRVRMGEWYSAADSCQPFLAAHLAQWISNQSVLPDTYFVQKKEIESIEFIRHDDGTVELEIQNVGDKWPIKRTFSLKQRFLVYRFLESLTKGFNQTAANLAEDSGKEYNPEPNDALTSLFKNGDASLPSLLIGKHYFILKYFVEMNGDKKRFYTHRTISGNADNLKEDFLSAYAKGYVPKFNPETIPRATVKPVDGSSYDLVRKRHANGVLRIHVCHKIGILESRPKGAKSTETFPLCGIILEDGSLLMRSNFSEKDLFVDLLT